MRRPSHERSADVQALLSALRARGFDGAPRPLGFDDHGREVVEFIEGTTYPVSPVELSDAQVVSAARLVRAFHDATVGMALAGGHEIVAHGDLGPHNIVFVGECAVGIIDWDADVGPGSRLVDLAHAAWCCADLCDARVAVGDQAQRLRVFCEGYGWDDVGAVLDELAARFRRARADHAAAGRHRAAVVFEGMLAWLGDHRDALLAPAAHRTS